MTEQDERTIYEWAKPEYMVRDIRVTHPALGTLIGDKPLWAYCTAEGHYTEWCHPLDMNFVCDVCTSRLRIEGFQVDMWTYEGRSNPLPFGVRIHGYSADASFKAFVKLSDMSLREAFYSALLAYIKGNTNA